MKITKISSFCIMAFGLFLAQLADAQRVVIRPGHRHYRAVRVIPRPVVYVAPRPVYVAPRPVVVAPRRVYVAPNRVRQVY
jgi:hypothetical protein